MIQPRDITDSETDLRPEPEDNIPGFRSQQITK